MRHLHLIKKRFLAELAYFEFSSKGLVEITRDDFNNFCVNYAKKYGLEDHLEKFVTEIERAGVLEVGGETVLFNHRSFLDYYSSFYIYTNSDEFDDLNGFIVEMYFNDSWGETAFFYVGQRRQISEKLLDRILDFDQNSLWVNSQKFLAGHLLQAGWYSPTKVKYDGIQKALGFVPAVRESLYRIAEKGKWPEPKIMVDVLLLAAANYSFRSTFLAQELEQLFNHLTSQEKQNDLSTLIYLLSVMKPFLPHEKFREEMERILTIVSDNVEIEPAEKLRATLLLTIMKGSDKSLTKTIRKRLTRLREQFPKEFKNLLPPAPTEKPQFNPPMRRKSKKPRG